MKKNRHYLLKTWVFSVSIFSFSAHAGLWEDSKQAATSAWEKTKEVSTEAWEYSKETGKQIKDGAKESWDDVSAGGSKENSDGSLSDLKKLGEKETYVNAWEGIKESAREPGKPNTDEHGIPK